LARSTELLIEQGRRGTSAKSCESGPQPLLAAAPLDGGHEEGNTAARLRFRRGRHTIVAHAVDGAGTSARVVSATVVVR